MLAVFNVNLLIPAGVILFAFVLLLLNFYLFSRFFSAKRKSLKGRHVVITGGSSGIGKSLAMQVAALGAHVTIISRNIINLERAIADIKKHCKDRQSQRIQYAVLDVTSDYENVKKTLSAVEEDVGPVYMLVNCAGMAICGRLEDMAIEDVKHMINLNYFGTVYLTKALIGDMKTRGEGIIVFVSTQSALLGIYGYSSYGAAKWAVRGLGEALLQELIGTGVTLTLCFPPDTDTPGFETEEASKPTETKLISESGGLYSPDAVAKQLLADALTGRTHSSIGLEGWMLKILCVTAWSGTFHLLQQIFLLVPFRIILAVYQMHFKSIILRCKKDRNTKKKAE